MARVLRNVCWQRRDRWYWSTAKQEKAATPFAHDAAAADAVAPNKQSSERTQPYFRFRKHWIPLLWDADAKDWACPTIDVLDNVGMFIDRLYKWKRGSPDGLVVINGFVIGMIEIKCSLFGVTSMLRMYYYDQIQVIDCRIACTYHMYVVVEHDLSGESVSPIHYVV